RCRVHAAEDFKEADPAELAAMAADMRSGTRRRRVLPVRFGGRDGWLKIALDEGWRKRVGRGAPGKALLRELAVIGSRRADGLPAFAVAGATVDGVHRNGKGQGRGQIEDVCWDGTAIHLIDFESVHPDYDAGRDAHREIVTFVHHCHFVAMAHGVQPTEELRVFQRAYRAAGRGEVLERAQHWARRHWWLGSLSAPLAFLSARNRANDLKAILPALAVLAYF